MVKLRKPKDVPKDRRASRLFALGSFVFFVWALATFYGVPENQGRNFEAGWMILYGLAWGYASHCTWPYKDN